MKTHAPVNYCSNDIEYRSNRPQYVGKIGLDVYFYLKSKGVANTETTQRKEKINISQH
jgi:hypothetical protein